MTKVVLGELFDDTLENHLVVSGEYFSTDLQDGMVDTLLHLSPPHRTCRHPTNNSNNNNKIIAVLSFLFLTLIVLSSLSPS